MTFLDLKESSARFAPAFAIDRMLSYSFRHTGKATAFLIAVLSGGIVLLPFFASEFSAVGNAVGNNWEIYRFIFAMAEPLRGIFLGSLGVWLAALAIDAFYFSILLSDEAASLREFPPAPPAGPVSIDVANLAFTADLSDITGSFCRTPIAARLFVRLGLTAREVDSFIVSPARVRVDAGTLRFGDDAQIGFLEYAAAVHKADDSLRSFLRTHSISDAEFASAARWVASSAVRIRRHRRWWSRDYLGRTPALGTSFSYGRAYSLEKYGRYLTDTSSYRDGAPLLRHFREEAEELERVLVRSRGANALVVAADPEEALLVAISMARIIERGEALPPLEHKRFFLLDPERVISSGGTKALAEAAFDKAFSDAEKAGNLVLVIPNLASLMQSAGGMGVDISSLLDPHLRNGNVHFIALADAAGYHRVIERNTTFIEHFERVLVKDKGDAAILFALERSAEAIERREGVLFSHPALVEAEKQAQQVFSEGNPLDKATDLITEAAVSARGSSAVIGPDEIRRLVSEKTGVPAGRPTDDERATLLKLESVLRARVVGQDEAVSAVAGALRRSRAGIRDEKKPMGTFLFLGPTGVGKTETAKALAEAYFGSEDAMVRFDMSEFSGADALSRLMGSAQGDAGILISRLREKPFSVLLFDELEKASVAVRDIFLQLLDEGFVTDPFGRHAYARSAFIIATSNAASAEIFRLSEEGKDLVSQKDRIVKSVIESGVFRPELINRFDGVIFFRPVQGDLAEAIARKLLAKFAARLEERGYVLVVNDALVRFVARAGADPKFGARPINRAITEQIEQAVADKIIAGDLRPGARIEFAEEDLP